MKRKVLVSVLALSMAVAMAGCGSKEKKTEAPATEKVTEAAATEAVTEAAETEAVTEAVTEAAETEAVTEAVTEAAETEVAAEEETQAVTETEMVTEAAAQAAGTEAEETEEETEAATEAAETEEVTEAVTEAAETEEATEAVTEAAETEEETEAVTEAAANEEATEAVTEAAETEEATEAVTEAAATEEETEAVTEAAENEEATEAVTEAAETEEATEAATEEATEAVETNSSGITCVDDLEGKTIGVQLGTTGDIYASDYEGDDAGTVVDRYSKGNDAVMALKQGKADCVIIDSLPAEKFVEKNDDLMILDEEFALEEYAICVSKDNKELTEAINGALAELKEEGILDQINANYLDDETKGTCPYESPEDVDRSNGTLVMATNAYFEPYEYYKGDTIVGIDVEMAQAVCDKLGYELKIDDIEFDAIVNAVQSGKADIGVAGMTVTEDRLKNIDFTDSYTTAKQVIIVRK